MVDGQTEELAIHLWYACMGIRHVCYGWPEVGFSTSIYAFLSVLVAPHLCFWHVGYPNPPMTWDTHYFIQVEV